MNFIQIKNQNFLNCEEISQFDILKRETKYMKNGNDN